MTTVSTKLFKKEFNISTYQLTNCYLPSFTAFQVKKITCLNSLSEDFLRSKQIVSGIRYFDERAKFQKSFQDLSLMELDQIKPNRIKINQICHMIIWSVVLSSLLVYFSIHFFLV